MESHNEFNTHVSEMQQGLISWNTEATQYGCLCIFLLQLTCYKTTQSSLFDISHHIASYLIPSSVKVAHQETGYLSIKTPASFFFMNRASEIIQDISNSRSREKLDIGH